MPLTGPIIRQYQPQQAVGVTPQDINASLQAYIQGITAANAPQMAEDQALNRQLKNLMMQEQILRLQGQVGALKNPEQAAASKMALSLADDAGKPTSNVETAARAGDVLGTLIGQTIAQPGTVTPEQQAAADQFFAQYNDRAYRDTGGNFKDVRPDLTSINTPAGTPTGFYDNPNKALEYEAQKEALKGYNLPINDRRMVGNKEIVPAAISSPKLEVKKEGNEMVVRNATTQEVVRREPLANAEDIIKTDHGSFRYTPGQQGPATLIEGTAPTATKPAKPLPTKISERISDAESAIDNLIKLKSYIDSPDVIAISGPVAGRNPLPGGGANPWSEIAGNFDGVRNTAKQKIGKYLEGGVLRLEDEKKYDTIIPGKKMLPAVQQTQSQNLYDTLRESLDNDIASYEASGYDVERLKEKIGKLDDEYKNSYANSVAKKSGAARPVKSPTSSALPRVVKITPAAK